MFDIVVRLALDQQGAFSTAQALSEGVSASWLCRHTASGLLVRRAPAVYALAAAPATARQRLMVELLAAGPQALATDDSALALWCPELVLPRRPLIVVPLGCGRRSTTADVRRSRDLHLAKPGVVDGIPVVGVARALLDASHGRTVDEVLQRIDACRRHSSLAVGALIEALHVHARRGRPGIATFRSAVTALRAEVTDSEFERLVIRDLVALGVPEPRLHHLVRIGQDAFELDLDWPGSLLDVELDGGDHIDRMRRAREDRRRDRILQASGWMVARYTWDDYVRGRWQMIREIADLLERCRRRP